MREIGKLGGFAKANAIFLSTLTRRAVRDRLPDGRSPQRGYGAGRFQNSSAVRKNQRENALSGRENAAAMQSSMG